MRLSWLEDFVTLVEAGTFSRAAALRNVTQPAFSRRIQMLESWLGLELVARGGYQLRLTRTGQRFEARLRGLVARIYQLRSEMRADASAAARLTLGAQHTLMVTHLPALLRRLQARQRHLTLGIRAGNREECVGQLERGEVDLLLCFERPGETVSLAGTRRLQVGAELLLPVCAPDLRSASVSPGEGSPLQVLSYPPESFLGQVVHDHCLGELSRAQAVEIVCESAFTMGLREMALVGMGVAWLPLSLVSDDLRNGLLVRLDQELGQPSLQVALYCLHENTRPTLQAAWAVLAAESSERHGGALDDLETGA